MKHILLCMHFINNNVQYKYGKNFKISSVKMHVFMQKISQ